MSDHPLVRLKVSTQSRGQFVEVTTSVQKAIRQHNVTEGYAIVFVPHTTASVYIKGADFLRGVRRAEKEARAGKDHRGIIGSTFESVGMVTQCVTMRS